jgi:hypothetical protein
LWLAVGWLSIVAGVVWSFGPVGLIAGGSVALLLGALVVDWEEVARGEPAGKADSHR